MMDRISTSDAVLVLPPVSSFCVAIRFPNIDVLAVPAGVYFLWVVQMLARGTYTDWNRVRAVPARSAA